MSEPRPPVPWQAQFVLLSMMWGSSFLYIKVIGRHWPALWVALGRIGLGAITLVVLAVALGEPLRMPDRRLLRHLVVVAVLFNALPFTLYAYGEEHVSSIVAGLWNATTPLWVLVATLVSFREERLTVARMLGLLAGFLGVAMLLGPWRGLGGGQLRGHLACAAAAASYGIAFPYTRRHLAARAEAGVVLAAGQLVCATVLLALLTPFSRGPSLHIGLAGLGSILGLGVLSSGVAYILNYSLVRSVGSAVASTVTYLIPVVAAVLGAIVLSERLHWNQAVGTAMLLAGIAITQGRLRLVGRRRPVAEAEGGGS